MVRCWSQKRTVSKNNPQAVRCGEDAIFETGRLEDLMSSRHEDYGRHSEPRFRGQGEKEVAYLAKKRCELSPPYLPGGYKGFLSKSSHRKQSLAEVGRNPVDS